MTSQYQQCVSRIISGPSLASGEGICVGCRIDRRSAGILRSATAGLSKGFALAMSSHSNLCMTTFWCALRSLQGMRREMRQH
jgi:hypothetical protein